MKPFVRLMLMTLGFGLLAALTGLVGPQPPATQAAVAAAVAVVNTPNVNVSNSPTVNAQQSGPWNVGINGVPSVNVVSLPPLPPPALTAVVNIDDHGRIPFVSGFSNSCSGTLCSYTFPAVPAGHRVVIEHISGNLNFNAAPTVITMFVNTATTSQIQFNVPPGNVGNASFFDQPLLYYVDGGQSPVVIFTSGFTNFNPAAGQNLTLVGYELDCNAAPCAAIATR